MITKVNSNYDRMATLTSSSSSNANIVTPRMAFIQAKMSEMTYSLQVTTEINELLNDMIQEIEVWGIYEENSKLRQVSIKYYE